MFSRQFARPVMKYLSNDGFLRATLVRHETSRSPETTMANPNPKSQPSLDVTSATVPEPEIVPRPKQVPGIESKAILDVNKQEDDLLNLALPFDEVPGPQILKILAKAWSYLPIIGTQVTAGSMVYLINMLGANLSWNRAVRPFNHMFEKYGPVVRLQGPLGGDIVFLSRPEHIEIVYRQEGRYPVRSSLDSLEQYRLDHRKLRISGPFIMSGPEWETLRTKLEVPLQRCVVQYSEHLEAAAEEMVTRIRVLRSKQEEVPKNFYMEIFKWSLECMGLVTFNKRLGCLEKYGLHATSETTRLLDAMSDATAALRKCESGFQLWRFVDTPAWRKLVTACDIIDSIAAKHIRLAQTSLRSRKEPGVTDELQQQGDVLAGILDSEPMPLLEMLLLNEGLYPEDLLTVILDMLLVGVNSTAHAMSFLLYHVSQSTRVQRVLFEEVLTILPRKDSKLTLTNVHKLSYLQACIKESLRLKPPIPVMTRVLPKDIALHCYRIPKGTHMLMTCHVASLKEENFEDAFKFKPERWLSGDRDIHPFAAIPFGHGPRSCLGRNLAELQLWLLTAKLVRNFRVEYHYGAINATTRLIAMPDRPLKFRFVDRRD